MRLGFRMATVRRRSSAICRLQLAKRVVSTCLLFFCFSFNFKFFSGGGQQTYSSIDFSCFAFYKQINLDPPSQRKKANQKPETRPNQTKKPTQINKTKQKITKKKEQKSSEINKCNKRPSSPTHAPCPIDPERPQTARLQTRSFAWDSAPAVL